MPYLTITPSDMKTKKWKAIFYDHNKKKVKTVHFGAAGAEDYTQHKDPIRKDRYIQRHRANEDWNNPMTAGALSRWVLWEYSNFDKAVASFRRRFGFHSL